MTGPAGNIEYLLWLEMADQNLEIDLEQVKQIALLAQKELT